MYNKKTKRFPIGKRLCLLWYLRNGQEFVTEFQHFETVALDERLYLREVA